MKTHRFIGNFELKKGSLKLQDEELLNQIRNVLKLKTGEKIIIGDGYGNEGTAEIKGYGISAVEVEVLEVGKNQNELKNNVILYCAILKKENFELVVQKATEVGAKEIVPVVTERTVKLSLRKDRLEKIIKEASEQSGRGIVPKLHDPIYFDKLSVIANHNELNLIFDISGESFEDLAHLNLSSARRIGVWIGPEGGWTERELESALKLNFKVINSGKLTLRAETAAIVATYLAIHN